MYSITGIYAAPYYFRIDDAGTIYVNNDLTEDVTSSYKVNFLCSITIKKTLLWISTSEFFITFSNVSLKILFF